MPQPRRSALRSIELEWRWTYDDDGDVRFRVQSSQQPWVDAVFYELDPVRADFSVRGLFLDGKATPQGDGTSRWEVSLESGHTPTAVARKIVTVYFMPRPGSVSVQIHASFVPTPSPRPMRVKLIPQAEQIRRIEREFPGFVGAGDETNFWMSAAGHRLGSR